MKDDIKIGITGMPGAGKTFALQRVIDKLKAEGVVVGGMVTEAVMDDAGRHKVGFKVTNLFTGESVVFGEIGFESKVMVGKIGIDIARFETVAPKAIKDAWEQCDIVIIDEVGKIEVESPAFVDAVKEALDEEKPMILTLHKKSRNPMLQDIRRRDDVRILEVTPTNRNILPVKIVNLMNGETI